MEPVQDFIKQLKDYLASEPTAIDKTIANEMGKHCKSILLDSFKERKFKVRLSSIGKPMCQQQMEKAKAESEPLPDFFAIKMLRGGVMEAVTIALLKAAGVKVDSVQKKVEFEGIKGTYDIIIDGILYDIKWVSRWSYENKFKDFFSLYKEDSFGYLEQGIGYSEAAGVYFGGWIVGNIDTGEIKLCEFPYAQDRTFIVSVMEKIRRNKMFLDNDKEFKRCFSPEEETFRNQTTGHKVLGMTCSYCRFKTPCWGKDNLSYEPDRSSKAQNPRYKWYVREHSGVK